MSTENSPNEKQQPTTTGKKPYEKPSYRFEKVFVTTALTCGKTGQESSCQGLVKVS